MSGTSPALTHRKNIEIGFFESSPLECSAFEKTTNLLAVFVLVKGWGAYSMAYLLPLLFSFLPTRDESVIFYCITGFGCSYSVHHNSCRGVHNFLSERGARCFLHDDFYGNGRKSCTDPDEGRDAPHLLTLWRLVVAVEAEQAERPKIYGVSNVRVVFAELDSCDSITHANGCQCFMGVS